MIRTAPSLHETDCDSTMDELNNPDDILNIEFNFSDIYKELNFSHYNNASTFVLDPMTLSCDAISIDPEWKIAVCVFYSLVFLLAVPGNFVVMVVIGFSKQALLPSDLYLFHLALADALQAVTLPFWASATVQGWLLGDVLCKLVNLAQDVSFYGGVLLLVCISVDRYLNVVRAAEARREGQRRRRWEARGACVSVWVLGSALSLPALLNRAHQPPGSDWTVCSEAYNPEQADAWRLATRLLRLALGFLLPLAIMTSCYGSTAARLMHTRVSRKRRALRLIAAVGGAFLLCRAPHQLALVADMLQRAWLIAHDCDARYSVDLTLFATQGLGLLHSCVNPILYAFVGEKFRKNLTQLLHRKRALERGSASRVSKSSDQASDNASTFL